ncbi:hypothetical protein [Streptomyces griseus]|uniref:hypothetical protein n=1 Tax=Streptomyces griseus TaxID=1911 RepID=UPI003404DFFE
MKRFLAALLRPKPTAVGTTVAEPSDEAGDVRVQPRTLTPEFWEKHRQSCRICQMREGQPKDWREFWGLPEEGAP